MTPDDLPPPPPDGGCPRAERRRAQLLEALAERTSAALEQGQAETVRETAVLVGLDGQVQARSQQTVDHLPHRPEDPAWPSRREQGAADALAARQAAAKARLSEGRAVRYTERKEGRIRDCSLHPILGADGQVKAFAGFTRDITEQLRLQERVHQAAAFQRALFSSLSEGILVLDEHGAIVDCNRAVETTLGMARAALIGHPAEGLCAQAASWEQWEQQLRPRLTHGGEPVQLELRLRRADGASFTARVSASLIELPGADRSVVWTIRDVTDELLRYEQLEHLATHDALTGLPNRLLFHDRLERALASAQRYRTSFAVIMMDLDGFKPVNDSLGHEMGDRLLAALGARLQGCLRAADTVSRLGGDEFAVLLPNSISAEQAGQVAAKLLQTVEQPFVFGEQTLNISASIGVAMFPEHVDLLARADQAMYAAKRRGGRQVATASGGGGTEP